MLADRLVVDLLAGVVAAPGGHLAERADRQVQLIRRERGPVHEVGPVAAEAPFRGDLGDRVHAVIRRREREMAQVHEGLHGLELDGERQGVAERAEGVREAVEQIRVLVVGGGADDAAVAGQDLHLDDRLVRHPVAQRSGLDAQPGDRPAEGDRLELRDHQRHQPVPQRRVAQVLVGGHAADPGGAAGRVDFQHVTEGGDVQPARSRGARRGLRDAVAEPEEVRGALGQADGSPGRQRRVGLAQPGHGGLVRVGRHAAPSMVWTIVS